MGRKSDTNDIGGRRLGNGVTSTDFETLDRIPCCKKIAAKNLFCTVLQFGT